jgi:hypothetical protein
MDQALLVKSDRAMEAQILDAVSRAHQPPISLSEWQYAPELEEWQLIIASPWVDTKGPRATYRALVDALEKAGVYDQIQWRRVFLRSPNDAEVKRLQRETVSRTEGFVHLLRNGTHDFSLVFAPVVRNGAVPSLRFYSLQALEEFIRSELRIPPMAAERAMAELKGTWSASIYPVTLTSQQIRKFGLN